jgi:hypothetical protein
VTQRIRSDKVLSKENEADLKRAIEQFNQSRGSSQARGNQPAAAGAR